MVDKTLNIRTTHLTEGVVLLSEVGEGEIMIGHHHHHGHHEGRTGDREKRETGEESQMTNLNKTFIILTYYIKYFQSLCLT